MRASSVRWSRSLFVFLLVASAVLLALGLLLPAFTSQRLWSDPRSFSIVSGAANLFREGSVALAIVIVLFSIAFPIGKLIAMAALGFGAPDNRHESRAIRGLEVLGKWSMLDVFVVATLIGAARLKLISKVSPEPGIYLFAAAIITSMIASYLLAETLSAGRKPVYDPPRGSLRATSLMLGLLSLVVFVLGVAQPLMQVEKWLFWDRQYSLFSALFEMWAQNEYLLPIVIALFVIVLPMLRFCVLLMVRVLGRASPPLLTRIAFSLEKWSMWDVYALALVVVIVKLGDLADVKPLIGFWLILMAIILSAVDGWVFRSRLRF